MAQPKAKTRLEQMGFVDPDIKSPSHDDLIALFIPQQRWLINGLYPPVPGMVAEWNISYRTEVPITDGKFIIGFIDMSITAQRKLICEECRYAEYKLYENEKQFCDEHNSYDWRLRDQRDRDAQECKLCIAIRSGVCSVHKSKVKAHERQVNFLIEFKTSKFTAGEVLRQMNTYRRYCNQSDKFILVTHGPCPHKPVIWNEKISIIERINERWYMNWKSDVYDIYDGDVPE